MAVAGLLVLLAAAAAPPPTEPPAPIHNYLKGARPRGRCGEAAANGEIVVCGSAELQESYRLRPIADADRFAERHVDASVALPGGSAVSARVASKQMPGATSQRAMITLSVPFK